MFLEKSLANSRKQGPHTSGKTYAKVQPLFSQGCFTRKFRLFFLNSAWWIDPWSCLLLTWIIRKIIDIALHRRCGPLKTICSCGLREERLPVIDRKTVLSNPSSARHKNRSPRIQVSDSCYERWFGGIRKNVGQHVVELEIILCALMFCFPSFFYLSL